MQYAIAFPVIRYLQKTLKTSALQNRPGLDTFVALPCRRYKYIRSAGFQSRDALLNEIGAYTASFKSFVRCRGSDKANVCFARYTPLQW